MRPTILIIFCFVVLVVSSCQKQKESSNTQAAKMISLESPPPAKEVEIVNQIIKTADYRFQVEQIDSATKAITRTVLSRQGSISSMSLTNSVNQISNQLTIRVPSKNFEILLDELGRQSVYTDHKRISTEDVTEEYVDIETRLRTKKEVRDRYIDILKTKAKTVEDVLKAEEQIRIIQEEIETKEGRLNYLKNRVAESTINLEIYQRTEYRERPGDEGSYWAKIKEGFSNGWKIAKNALLAFINIWPVVLVMSVVYWRRNWLKAIFRKKA